MLCRKGWTVSGHTEPRSSGRCSDENRPHTGNFDLRVLTYLKRAPTQILVHRPAASASPGPLLEMQNLNPLQSYSIRVCILERFLDAPYTPYSLRSTGVQNSEKEGGDPTSIWEHVGVCRH